MKVKELIEALSHCDDDDDVHIAYPAGDYWRTTLAPAVARVTEGEIEHSGYHRCDKLITEDRDRESDDPPTRSVVVLR